MIRKTLIPLGCLIVTVFPALAAGASIYAETAVESPVNIGFRIFVSIFTSVVYALYGLTTAYSLAVFQRHIITIAFLVIHLTASIWFITASVFPLPLKAVWFTAVSISISFYIVASEAHKSEAENG